MKQATTNDEKLSPVAIHHSAQHGHSGQNHGHCFLNNNVVKQRRRGFSMFVQGQGSDESYRPPDHELHYEWNNDDGPVMLGARPFLQYGGTCQTSTHQQVQVVDIAATRIESQDEPAETRLMQFMIAKLGPNDDMSRLKISYYTGGVAHAAGTELLSSSSTSSLSSFCPLLPPFVESSTPTRPLLYKSNDTSACPVEEEYVNDEGGLALPFPRCGSLHDDALTYQTSTKNDEPTESWFGGRQQLTLPAGLFLYASPGDQRDDFSSLSDDDNHTGTCHPQMEAEEEPAATNNDCAYSRQDEILGGDVVDSFDHGHSRRHHKSLSATIKTKNRSTVVGRAIDHVGALRQFGVTASADGFCNQLQAAQQQHGPQSTSFLFHDDMSLSLLKNHHQCVGRARTVTTDCDDDSFVVGAWSPLTLSSSTSSLFGSIALPPPAPSIHGNRMATTTTTTATSQQGVFDHTKKMEATRNKGGPPLPMDLQSTGQEGYCTNCHPTKKMELNPSVPPGPPRRSHQQSVEGSKKKAKNTPATCKNHHDMDHPSVDGKAKGDEGENAKKHEEAKKDLEEEDDVQLEQGDQWYARFQELVEYKSKNGDCNVPFRRSYKNNDNNDENPASTSFLAAWVKRQRYQYKCKVRGKHSHLTDERQKLLEELGFVWDTHVAAWEENFALMTEFYKQHGHCRIPIKQKELSDWAKRQRRHYKHKMMQQEDAKVQSSSLGATRTTTTTCTAATTTMSQDRIRRLNEIKFQWATMTPSRRSTTPATKAKKKKGEGPDDDGASRKSKRPRRQRSRHQLVSV